MDARIAVLAGGRGERLGGGKPTAELGGRPLIAHAVEAAVETGLPAFVVAKPETALPPLDVPVLREPERPSHPLQGILAALGESAGAPVVAVGCDMPFVTPALLAWLGIQPDQIAVPRVAGEVHGLLGRYAAGAGPVLSRSLERGHSVSQAIGATGARYVTEAELEQFGDPRRLLFNVNTPGELKQAEQMLGEGPARP